MLQDFSFLFFQSKTDACEIMARGDRIDSSQQNKMKGARNDIKYLFAGHISQIPLQPNLHLFSQDEVNNLLFVRHHFHLHNGECQPLKTAKQRYKGVLHALTIMLAKTK